MAGFFGAITRYALSGWTGALFEGRFPAGTAAVNIIGSLLLGFIYTLSMERAVLSPEVRLALTVGFLGSFTTFSTFSLESYNLMREGSFSMALLNIVLNLFAGIAAVFIGVVLAKILYGVK